MLFVQSGNLIFAAESKSVVVDGTVINIEENDDVRICSSLEKMGQVVVTLDKHTNVMTQKITDPSSGKILNVQTWDLSKHNNPAPKISKGPLTSKKSCYTWSGYNYWLDEDPKLNCLYCEKHDGQNKTVFFDLSSSSSINSAYKFADKSEDIRKAEWALDGSVLLLICELFFPGGTIAETISKSALT